MKFYMCGQMSFANRGCEALIRSNAKLLREKYPNAEIYCPSINRELDLRQWPDAKNFGVTFVDAPKYPTKLKIWNRLQKAIPWLEKLGRPRFEPDSATRALMLKCDAVLMTGGDIISLEYGKSSLYFWSGLMDAASRLGRRTYLVAASVGPFSKEKVTEANMIGHLAGYKGISVRESSTFSYLSSIGVVGHKLVVDPAFVLDDQHYVSPIFEQNNGNVIGLNFSPLIRKFRGSEESRKKLDSEIVKFLCHLVADRGYKVLLISHVSPLNNEDNNSDHAYMQGLLNRVPVDLKDSIELTSDRLNAAQLKYVLSQCLYFIGARTHSTIGALSKLVPTISISYSIKSIGINVDLFGHEKYILATPDVSFDSLVISLQILESESVAIRDKLKSSIPVWKNKTRSIVEEI